MSSRLAAVLGDGFPSRLPYSRDLPLEFGMYLRGKTLEMGFFGSREYAEPMLGRQGCTRVERLGFGPLPSSFPLPRSKLKIGPWELVL